MLLFAHPAALVQKVIGLARVGPVLAGFGDSYWACLLLPVPLLAFISLAHPDYSNWALLLVFTLLAQPIAWAAGRLHTWPNATLVPGFAVGVFLTCIGTVVGVALLSVFFAWMRDAVPALGPALLVCIGTVSLALRFGRYV